MTRLQAPFRNLRDYLILWRDMGHGLWPVRGWPDKVIENYLLSLQECSVGTKPVPILIPNVRNGEDLILLVRRVLSLFPEPSPPGDEGFSGDQPIQLLETILFALIGLVHPEEPGELTVEEVLAAD